MKQLQTDNNVNLIIRHVDSVCKRCMQQEINQVVQIETRT